MDTINSAVPTISHRVRPQAPVQSMHGRREEADNAVRPAQTASEPKAKGVLRLIQEDHFKGVADVRLRINFHQQLQALEDAAARDTTRQAVDTLDRAVSDSIAGQVQVPSPVVEALQGFQTNLAQLAESGDDAASIGDAVDKAFTGLTTSLRDLLELDAHEQPEEDIDTKTGAADELSPVRMKAAGSPDDVFDADALISALKAGFADFEAALSTSSESHRFTPPNGNGVAFDRFLDIYETLSSAETSLVTDEQATPLIDLTA